MVLTEVQPSSPAEVAGFRPGDQLLKVGDLPVTNALDIERALLDAQPGQPTKVAVRRDGHDQVLSIDVRALGRSGGTASLASATSAPTGEDSNSAVWRSLGLKVIPVDSRYVANVDSKLHGGLFVQSVQSDSPGARADIRKGDILVGLIIGKRELETVRTENVVYILRQPELASSPLLPFFIIRDQVIQKGAMSLADIARAEGSVSR